MAYVRKKERERRDDLDKRPFGSRYFRLKYVEKGAFGNPGFPWYLVAKAGKRFYESGFRRKYVAQEQAAKLDDMIDGIVSHVFAQLEKKHGEAMKSIKETCLTDIARAR